MDAVATLKQSATESDASIQLKKIDTQVRRYAQYFE